MIRNRIPSVVCTAVLFLATAAVCQELSRTTWGERFSSAGTEVRLIEVQRTPRSDGGTYVQYFVQGIGLPKDRPYSLWEWELGGEPKLVLRGIRLRDDAVALCSGKPNDCSGASDEQVYVVRLESMKGEPKRFALVSSDGKARAFGGAVPFPAVAENGNCRVSLLRQSRDASEFIVRGEGFQPNEKVSVTMGGPAPVTQKSRADEKGAWTAALHPTSADGSSPITAKAGKCEVATTWAWGAQAEKIE